MMPKKNVLYWIAMLSGWGAYIAFLATITFFSGKLGMESIQIMLLVFLLGILISHAYRLLIVKLGWVKLSIPKLIPRVLLAAVFYAVVFYLIEASLIRLIYGYSILTPEDFYQQAFNWYILCIIWSSFYFVYQYFSRSRDQEIKNLKLEAASREIELSSLKSQLNPHFLFNSLNSIRALIHEDPEAAKAAVTLLSNILRNSLMLGKKKKVMLEEEFTIIREYLQLEKVRFEERLQLSYDLQPNTLSCYVPPLMLQTIVENAIKHGIANLPEGGTIAVSSVLVGEQLQITVRNSGRLHTQKRSTSTGIGLPNSQKRLALMYGDDASLEVKETDGAVETCLIIPKDTTL